MKMKKWSGSVVIFALFGLLVLRCGIFENPLTGQLIPSFARNTSDFLHWKDETTPPSMQNPYGVSKAISTDNVTSILFRRRNFSVEELQSLQTWRRLKHLVSHAEGLPNALEAVKEATTAWNSLVNSILDEKRLTFANGSQKAKEKQCPYSIRRMNVSDFSHNEFRWKIPCGMVQGSSITIIGTPGGILGNFRIDLTGSVLPGEPDPPIILHYNVRLHGDKVTEDPVIVQNTWTVAHDWGSEERCPSPEPDDKKVDDLEKCSTTVGKNDKKMSIIKYANGSRPSIGLKEKHKPRSYFPFKQGHLVIATLRVGVEGIQMTVDGKHVTSFPYHESLEPWLINEVRISGDMKLISVLASGLPTSEDVEHVNDLQTLKAPPLPHQKAVHLFIGVVSTANNFKRRMAVRRTWMQYDAVRSANVAVRFFVGLHKNEMVNEELWSEARTYGDIQLMPFVDYYSLITWKTIAICIYGTDVVSAKYVMKTDDDAFVRVDEVLSSLNNANVTAGLLYGRINSDSEPHRNSDSKWYISPQEWPEEKYPPWAHGPGYVVSQDIAKNVHWQHRKRHLKMFKLEDVAMGIWISEMKKMGVNIQYVSDERIYNEGCEADYIVAHYQGPREMLCLWQKLLETHRARCCDE